MVSIMSTRGGLLLLLLGHAIPEGTAGSRGDAAAVEEELP